MQQDIASVGALDMEAISQRIRAMLRELNISGMAFCEATGIPYSTMRTYMGKAPRVPGAEFLVAAYRAFGVSPSWLLTGDGSMKADATTRGGGDFVFVPVLPAPGGPGDAPIEQQSASAVTGWSFSRHWLAQRKLSPATLRIVQVRGASMDKVLAHGDLVLIDQADLLPRSGFAYVIRQGDEVLVKFAQLLPGGTLRFSSANADFASYDVDLAKTPDVSIIGRVVASMHDW